MTRPLVPPEFARLLAPKRTRRKGTRKGGPGSADEPLPPLEVGTTLLALDVSSTCTGWAECEYRGSMSVAPWMIRSVELIRPRQSNRPWGRITETVWLCRDRVEEVDPHRIVMEWSEGHVHRGHAGHGLAVTGQAQGAVWESLQRLATVDLVGDDVWTRNLDTNQRPSKESRASWAYANSDAYREFAGPPRIRDGKITFPNDPGFDAADAVCLACWRCAVAAGRTGIKWK